MLAKCSRVYANQLQQGAFRCFNKMASSQVKVQIRQGVVIGQEDLLPNGETYHSFQGVPYAVPPIGDLRFRSPIPLESFDKPALDCTRERDPCHQREPLTNKILGSEDCLHLNVFAPAKPTTAVPLPVMVWIHGGGFLFGSSQNTLPLSLISEDVIVVTLNYRLGAWGFLCLPEEGIWGNAGLKDQRLALQWVHDNIAQFNGDPNNITLFGESAGAASVHLHTMASHSHKLFHKAIMQSGTANMEWVFQQNPENKVRRLCELLGCQSRNTRDMLHFLQSHDKVKPEEVLACNLPVLTADERRRGLPLAFGPVIEDVSSTDKFLSKPVSELIKQNNTAIMPTIIGYNSAEGMAMMVNAVRKLEEINMDLARFVPRNIPLPTDHTELKYLAEKMREFYFNGQQITYDQLDAMTNLLSDYHFVVDLQQAAKLQVQYKPNSPLYCYRFDYTGGRDLLKRLFHMESLPGACHADELNYLFQTPRIDSRKFAEKDKLIIKRLSALWTNFARYGNPTPAESDFTRDLGCVWTPTNGAAKEENISLDCFIIDEECRILRNPDAERIEFWKEIYQRYPPLDYSRTSAKL